MLVVLVLLSFVFASSGIAAYAATVGQSLKSPETGWKRIDDTDNNLHYIGKWATSNTGSQAFYGGGTKYIAEKSNQDAIKFKFVGTKLRIIAQSHSTRSKNIQVKIDNEIVGNYSIYSPVTTDQCLLYEKTGLEEK